MGWEKDLGISTIGPFADAFGRLRTSSTGQRFDVEFIYNKQPDLIDEITNNGSATFNPVTGDVTLSLSDGNNGSYAELRSHPIPYTPGNSQLVDITGTLDLAAVGGGAAEVFLRSSVSGSVTEKVIDESDWFIPTNGLDWSRSHIFSIDFQSLKVGTIRYMMVANGRPTTVAHIHNDNVRSTGYWRIPSLPLYWRLYTKSGNTYMECGYGDDNNAIGFRYKIQASASATMRAICGTVKSEGGFALSDLPGLPISVSNAQTPRTVTSALLPLLSVRSKDVFQTLDNLVLAIPKSISIQNSEPIEIVLVSNGTLTGASWVDVDSALSSLERDVSASAISGGRVISRGYKWASSSGPASGRLTASESKPLGKSLIWNRKSSETGIFSVCAIRTGAIDASCLASVDLEEI